MKETKNSILITGANKGLGFEAAWQLGNKGYFIFLTARDVEKGRAATIKLKEEGIDCTFVQLDVSDYESIQKAFKEVSKQTNFLHAIINNAGIALREDRDILTASTELVDRTLSTNALGPLYVTQLFAPLLKKGSRVINISSEGGSMTDPVGGWSPIYCVSKSLLNAITRHLAFALEDSGVAVNSVSPGWVKTDMGGSGANRSVGKGVETTVWLATEAPLSLTGKFIHDKRAIDW